MNRRHKTNRKAPVTSHVARTSDSEVRGSNSRKTADLNTAGPRYSLEVRGTNSERAADLNGSSALPSPQEPGVDVPRGEVWRDAIDLLPYQERWVNDDSQLKIAVWSRQSGKSFAAALRAVLKCLEKQTQYIILSKGERQSRLFMEKVKSFCQVLKEVKVLPDFATLEETEEKVMEVYFPHNRSRIIGLPANADAARGYSGHIVLDEFAFHGDADRIYAACFPIITRGYSIEIISTPNGTTGKFYEIAKQAGLVGADPCVRPPAGQTGWPASSAFTEQTEGRRTVEGRTHGSAPTVRWSGHRVDIYDALAQGLPANIALLRAGCDDEETWLQEYGCQFLSDAQNYIPLDLIASCVHEDATTDWSDVGAGLALPSPDRGEIARGGQALPLQGRELYLGVDIGRKRDLTIAWLFEKLGDVLWSRVMLTMKGVSFDEQEKAICGLIELPMVDGRLTIEKSNSASAFNRQSAIGNRQSPAVHRVCVDQSGLGMMLAEHLVQKYGAVVEPMQFTAQLKERLAPLVKQAFEERRVRIPDDRDVRADLNSVKRFVTPAGNIRFDAEHSDRGHADRFWALAEVLHAASSPAEQPQEHFEEAAALVGSPVMAGFKELVL